MRQLWPFVGTLCVTTFVLVGCGKSNKSLSSSSADQSSPTGSNPLPSASAAKTGTTYSSSNAGVSCLPSGTASAGTAAAAAALTKVDLSNLLPNGVLGAGFHNAYQVVTLTSAITSAGRTVALHLWIDSPGQDSVGTSYTRAGTVSVSTASAGASACSTYWYPATVTYKLTAPLVGDDLPDTRATGSYSVNVSGVGTGTGNFDATTTATLPVGVDMESCTQTTIGSLPDVHSNQLAADANSPTPSNPNTGTSPPSTGTQTTASTAYDASPMSYFFYKLQQEKTCSSGINCPVGYTVYGALTDDANFCSKVQVGSVGPVLPVGTKYVDISLDTSEQGLNTIPLGVSTVTHGTGGTAAATHLNLPSVGKFSYTGTFKINVLDPNTAQLEAYDFKFDPQGQPFERVSNSAPTSKACDAL